MLLAAADRLTSVEEIAKSYGISRNHLAKVAHKLQNLGYIEGVRGRNGGLRLGMPPNRIIVGEVVRQLESLDSFVECMSPGTNTCPAIGVCGLQGALSLALNDFLKRLDNYTIADLIPHPHRFVSKSLIRN
jgi:Rrf2 family nitric oxide-sensitive transcriptional repressor